VLGKVQTPPYTITVCENETVFGGLDELNNTESRTFPSFFHIENIHILSGQMENNEEFRREYFNQK